MDSGMWLHSGLNMMMYEEMNTPTTPGFYFYVPSPLESNLTNRIMEVTAVGGVLHAIDMDRAGKEYDLQNLKGSWHVNGILDHAYEQVTKLITPKD